MLLWRGNKANDSGSRALGYLSQALLISLLCLTDNALANPLSTYPGGLQVQISTAAGLLNETVDVGRILLLIGPTKDDLANTDDVSSLNRFFGKNVYKFSGQSVTMSGGSGNGTETGVWGWRNVSLNDFAPGKYYMQAYLNKYETVTRSDGSTVTVRFPCGDGATPFDGPGSLQTDPQPLTITGASQTVQLTFNSVVPPLNFTGMEIGGCSQGNYKDKAYLKHVKIRSEALSKFWNRDMYIGANILLPHGYNASDKNTRYPVYYAQDHWIGGVASQDYAEDPDFKAQWEKGIIPGQNGEPDRETPKLIIVGFRHETPFYDDSYAVNTANVGPYGVAINDEMVPLLDRMFNTIAKPYARIQGGGSTGGWESVANLIFRPDLFGACFSSYPDSMSFHRHQDIHLYEYDNAYTRPDGTPIPSIRISHNGSDPVVAITTAEENHWELTFGTASRSFLQWDIWFAAFGIQGLNGYPLAAWDKVTGKIYHDAVEFWKPMDLTNYILTNWNNHLNLGEVLRNRINIYVGSYDTYYLNEGVEQFQQRVSAKGGADWANVTIFPKKIHGGNYLLLDTWVFLELVETWVRDHAPTGKTPLLGEYTTEASRGNKWEDVIAYGGRQAALARQASPHVTVEKKQHGYGGWWGGHKGSKVQASVGKWDPGVVLEAQWIVNGKPSGKAFGVKQGQTLTYSAKTRRWRTRSVQLAVSGTKRDYADETRKSNVVRLRR